MPAVRSAHRAAPPVHRVREDGRRDEATPAPYDTANRGRTIAAMMWRFLFLLVAVGASMPSALAQSGTRQVSLVVTNGVVVTMDAAARVIRQGAVAIDGSDIVAVDTAAAISRQFRGRQTID